MPGFTPQDDQQARLSAIDRVRRNPLESVSVEHQLIIFEELGKVSTSYLEESMREIVKEQGEFPYVCSLSAISGSLAMWSLYGDRHEGIIFGISSRLDRLIADEGSELQQMIYSPQRPHTPFNNPRFEDVVPALWTKGLDWEHQQEWRILAEHGAPNDLLCGEVKEIIFGYRYDPAVLGDKETHMNRDVFQQTKFFDAFPSPTEYKMTARPIHRK
jgi:hypothetical protein